MHIFFKKVSLWAILQLEMDKDGCYHLAHVQSSLISDANRTRPGWEERTNKNVRAA
jgi:hypothetical protein